MQKSTQGPLWNIVKSAVPAIAAVFTASFFISLANLASLVYMESVFDRVFSSRNQLTLMFLTGFVLVVWTVATILETCRSVILARIALRVDRIVSGPLFFAVHRILVHKKNDRSVSFPVQAFKDLDILRETLAGSTVASLADAVWIPVYVVMGFFIHPAIGSLLLAAVGIVLALGFFVKLLGVPLALRSVAAGAVAGEFVSSVLRNSDTIRALGMTRVLNAKWRSQRDVQLSFNARANDASLIPQALLTFVKLSFGSVIFAVASILVINQMISAGNSMIVLMLSYRAIGPTANLIIGWKSLVSSKVAYDRLSRVMESGEADSPLPLPRPQGHLDASDVAITPPGARQPILSHLFFSLPAGTALGVIGPSGGGKSTLARAIIGVWPVSAGSIRLDGADISHWDHDELGQHLGYIPQDVELFSGSVAENIARFRDFIMEDVIAAAKLAGAHDLIQLLADGYNTQIGENGSRLSGGQRQRVALARAVYGRPSLVVLDEPNSNLDGPGEEALVSTIRELKRQGTTVVLITHRANILAHVDSVLVIANGAMHGFGAPEEVLPALAKPKVVQLSAPARK